MNPFEKARHHVRTALTLENLAAREAEVSNARNLITGAVPKDASIEWMVAARTVQDDLMGADLAAQAGLLNAADALLRAAESGLTKCCKLSWLEEAVKS